MKTIILLNPMGTDVTPFVTGAPLVPQLLKGTIRQPGDTVYTLPYVNQPGRQNVADGVEMLNTAIHHYIDTTADDVLVFGYSEGPQIADWWLTKYGQATPVPPSRLRFVLIANANRKYGGFVYGHSIFDAVGYTEGKPATTPYQVVDFTRQYDGVSDFPTAQPIQDALVGLQSVGTDKNAMSGAMNAVSAVLTQENYKTAALNAISGLVLIHNVYLYVALDDPGNRTLVEGNIAWVWSPTYPAPMLGLSTMFPSADREKRLLIEQAYQRPVSIPMPSYTASPAWGNPIGATIPTPPRTGWWAPVKAARGHGAGAFTFAILAAIGSRHTRGASTGGTYAFGGSAVGKKAQRAATAGVYAFAGGAATGRRATAAAAAAGVYGFTGSAAGRRTQHTTAAGGYSFAGSGFGTVARRATAAGAYAFAGTSIGKSARRAVTAGAYGFAGGPAVGDDNTRQGTAAGDYRLVGGPALGQSSQGHGFASGAYSFAGGSGSGRLTPKATSAGAYNFAGASTGRKVPKSAAAGSYTFAGTAAARKAPKATAAGAYNFAGTAAGITTRRAAAAGAYNFAGSATGQKSQRGTASGGYGFAGTTTGKKAPRATAAGGYNFAGTAVGVTPVVPFTPITEINQSFTNKAIPVGTAGVWVTADGGGGSGGTGYYSGNQNRGGGSGAGGGAKIPRFFIPVSALGSTYSSGRGLGGAAVLGFPIAGGAYAGLDGGDTFFTSGPVSVTAPGGKGGKAANITAAVTGGLGGVPSVSGVTAPTMYTGGTGGTGGTPAGGNGGAAANTGAGAGAPGGGGGSGLDGAGFTYGAGGKGGNGDGTGTNGGVRAGTVTTSAGGNATDQANGLTGGGGGGGGVVSGYYSGQGGNGGDSGAGGGGSSGTNSTANNPQTGSGGDGYLKLEWV